MGLRSWVASLLDGGGSSGGEEAEEGPVLEVDVERRAGAILEHYGLDGADARQVAEILSEELSREEGYARPMIANRVAREVELDEDRARRLVDTEVASIRNLARVREFERGASSEPRYRWVDSVGKDDSPVCTDVRATIDEQGPMTLAELRECLREAAADHDEGTPDRADDLVPHEGCRHTVVRHIEQ